MRSSELVEHDRSSYRRVQRVEAGVLRDADDERHVLRWDIRKPATLLTDEQRGSIGQCD